MKNSLNRKVSGDTLAQYLMLAPFMLIFIVYVVIPVISSAFLSFTSFDMLSMPKFNGLDNYKRMILDDEIFGTVVKNTLIFSCIAGPIAFILSFVLAWFINELGPKSRTLLSFLFYAPALVGNGYFIWQTAFSGDSYGYVNSLLLSMGVITEPITWLSDARYTMIIIIVVQLWQGMGVSFLSAISGLQNVNSELFEAGAIDGIHNRWQELWYLTLPSMSHMLLFGAVMQIQGSFSVSAVAIAMAGYPSVEHSVDTIVSYMADVGSTRYEMGYASAITVVLFLMMFVCRLLVGKLFGKKED
mgnify:CR=1 FL=1